MSKFDQLFEDALRSISEARRMIREIPFEQRHGRPKPPSVSLVEHLYYQEKHPQVVGVYRWGEDQWLAERLGEDGPIFPTHAEAIAHADRVTREGKS